MIIYEVNLNINNTIYQDYYSWLLEHVKKMLEYDGFKKAEIGLVDLMNEEEKSLRVSYTIDSYTNLEDYLKKPK